MFQQNGQLTLSKLVEFVDEVTVVTDLELVISVSRTENPECPSTQGQTTETSLHLLSEMPPRFS